MADPTTPNYGLTLPAIGLDRDTWGGLTNANWTAIDAALAGVAASVGNANTQIAAIINSLMNYYEPVGSLKAWPVDGAYPSGWMPCDGWAISRADWPDLFALIGTRFGGGDGSTTFNVPDLRGAVVAHRGAWITFQQFVGEVQHQLVWNEMPSHVHGGYTDWQGNHAHSYSRDTGTSSPSYIEAGTYPVYLPAGLAGDTTSTDGQHYHTLQVGSAGSDWSHNNIQPTMALVWIIKGAKVF